MFKITQQFAKNLWKEGINYFLRDTKCPRFTELVISEQYSKRYKDELNKTLTGH